MAWRATVLVGAIALMAAPGDGQDKPAHLAFEVASIKPAQAGGGEGVIRPMPAGQGYEARGASLKLMFSIMYRVPLWRIAGRGLRWMPAATISKRRPTVLTALTNCM